MSPGRRVATDASLLLPGRGWTSLPDADRAHQMPSSDQEPITIGAENGQLALVLGGGGMFGAYEAGVWLALQGRVDFDLVAGASIGALNGWVMASDCPAQEWVEAWLDLKAAAAAKFRFPKRPLGGIVESEVF